MFFFNQLLRFGPVMDLHSEQLLLFIFFEYIVYLHINVICASKKEVGMTILHNNIIVREMIGTYAKF